ncbi:MAG: FAD synthase [Thermoplasmatales archaeon]|nr:FAD synthase [Thermoplasmatales archaeon]
MVRVMASGVFDILHTGHVSYLEQARAMGDELVVVVASDETVRRRKHEPVTPESMRLRLVQSLKPVDEAVLGLSGGDMYSTLDRVRPDIIALGYDQDFDEAELSAELRKRGFEIEVRRAKECAEDLTATRRIIAKIRDREAVD